MPLLQINVDALVKSEIIVLLSTTKLLVVGAGAS